MIKNISNFELTMKHTFKYILWLSLLICSEVFLCCSEEFLHKEPIGVAAGSIIESPKGVEAVLVGTYAAMRGKGQFGGAMF